YTNATHRRLSVGQERSERFGSGVESVGPWGGSRVTEKLDGLTVTADSALIEVEELQAIIGEGQEKGFVAAEALATALDEADLSRQQAQDVLSYLEEHGVEVLAAGESASELHAHDAGSVTGGHGDDGHGAA